MDVRSRSRQLESDYPNIQTILYAQLSWPEAISLVIWAWHPFKLYSTRPYKMNLSQLGHSFLIRYFLRLSFKGKREQKTKATLNIEEDCLEHETGRSSEIYISKPNSTNHCLWRDTGYSTQCRNVSSCIGVAGDEERERSHHAIHLQLSYAVLWTIDTGGYSGKGRLSEIKGTCVN
jgi:hypothetical protein